MYKLILMTSILLSSLSAFATGGIYCSGETYSGKKISLGACMPHGLPGLCSNLSVAIDGKEVHSIDRDHIPEFAIAEIPGEKEEFLIVLNAYDEGYYHQIVDLRIKYKFSKSYEFINLAANLTIKDNDGKLLFQGKDITCEFE